MRATISTTKRPASFKTSGFCSSCNIGLSVKAEVPAHQAVAEPLREQCHYSEKNSEGHLIVAKHQLGGRPSSSARARVTLQALEEHRQNRRNPGQRAGQRAEDESQDSQLDA